MTGEAAGYAFLQASLPRCSYSRKRMKKLALSTSGPSLFRLLPDYCVVPCPPALPSPRQSSVWTAQLQRTASRQARTSPAGRCACYGPNARSHEAMSTVLLFCFSSLVLGGAHSDSRSSCPETNREDSGLHGADGADARQAMLNALNVFRSVPEAPTVRVRQMTRLYASESPQRLSERARGYNA